MPVFSFRLKHLLISVLPPAAAGLLGSFAVKAGAQSYVALKKPLLTPAPLVFAVAWMIYYAVTAFVLFRLAARPARDEKTVLALRLELTKLAAGLLWLALFFGLGMLFVPAVLIVLLFALELVSALATLQTDRLAGRAALALTLLLAVGAYVCIGVATLN